MAFHAVFSFAGRGSVGQTHLYGVHARMDHMARGRHDETEFGVYDSVTLYSHVSLKHPIYNTVK